MRPILYIFSGLPGTGKTTIASRIAQQLALPYFRLDTIEQGLRDICSINVGGEGYRLTYRVVSDNLKIGNDVIVDCVNPWELTRKEWESVAIENQARYINIEVICSDKVEHKQRACSRKNDIEGFELPSWEDICKRDYESWTEERIIVETSKKGIDECVNEVLNKIEEEKRKDA
jgi:predicted kinase